MYILLKRMIRREVNMRQTIELDELTYLEWRELFKKYLVTSSEAAEILNVSVPRITQLDQSGLLHSVIRGRYLKKDVLSIKEDMRIKREKYRNNPDIITYNDVFEILKEVHSETRRAVTPKCIEERIELKISNSDKVNIKNRVANALRILLKKKLVRKVKYGYYLPN